ncbi:hypothetical protein chiPu_0025044 [Chiloscyllium punctatum]|uniref:Uncharacterized protein n=1 Tax=Chiloscyllium punctatum TaxID=137246 RepID=A0A401TFV8_CHIPU|nr:hypothetical protein [Chiloscyllium punctatum]
MARSPWGTFSSFLRRGHASSVDTAGLTLPEAMGEEDEDELPTLSGANKLRMVLRDEEVVCNGAGADPNPGQGAGVPEEPPHDTRASEQKCNRCSKTSELARQKAVKKKLWIAMTLYVVFTVGEFIGRHCTPGVKQIQGHFYYWVVRERGVRVELEWKKGEVN